MSKNNKPLVSVFMPTYNHELYINEAILSVMNQTYSNWEIIIGDDFSTDRTESVVKSVIHGYEDKIKYYKRSSNIGITRNFNEILKECKGDYILIMSGDDVLSKEKMREQVKKFEENKNACLVYHDVEIFDSNTNESLKKFNSGAKGRKPHFGNSEKVAERVLLHGTSFISALSVMINRSVLGNLEFNNRIPVASDWLFLIDFLMQNKNMDVIYIDRVLASYRRHSQNITLRSCDYLVDNLVTISIIETKYPSFLKYTAKVKAKWYSDFAKCKLVRGDFHNARKYIISAMKNSFNMYILLQFINTYRKEYAIKYKENPDKTDHT